MVDYQVEVDLLEWGSIDSYLNFTRARGSVGKSTAVGEPVEQRTYETLVLRDRFLRGACPEKKREEKRDAWLENGPVRFPEDRCKYRPSLGNEMRDKSNDPHSSTTPTKPSHLKESICGWPGITGAPEGVLRNPLRRLPADSCAWRLVYSLTSGIS